MLSWVYDKVDNINMQNERLLYLLNAYATGRITTPEKSELEQWYQQIPVADQQDSEAADTSDFAATMLDEFRNRNAAPKQIPVRIKPVRRMVYWVAAAAILFAIITGGLWYNNLKKKTSDNNITFVKPVQPAGFVRQVRLPDGTMVVLQSGSTIKYPEAFTGPTRNVVLKGEAYFDVAHNPQQPFIISTGKLQTTVVGTAFTIQAWPGQQQITVTVARGKVKVAEGSKLLGTLTANQQLVYNNQSSAAQQQAANAVPATTWVKQGMNFNDVAFVTIAQQLQQRFQQPIQFEDSTTGSYLLNASFDGSEPLSQILDILCLTSGTRYTYENGIYLIRKKD